MPQCTHCRTPWTMRDKIRRFVTFSQGMPCPYCGTLQYYSLNSKRRSSYFIFPMLLFFFIPGFFDIPWQLHLLIAVVGLFVTIVLQIKTIELSDKEEYPF